MQREHPAYVPAGASSLDQKIIAAGSEAPTMLAPAALDALLGSAAEPGDVSAFAATLAAPPAVSASARAAQPQGMEVKPHRYTTVRQLGEGGMGDVLLSHDSSIGRRVAVKRMKRRLDPAATDQFLAEIQTTGQLEHPGIVPIYDVGQDEDGSPYFVMKYARIQKK